MRLWSLLQLSYIVVGLRRDLSGLQWHNKQVGCVTSTPCEALSHLKEYTSCGGAVRKGGLRCCPHSLICIIAEGSRGRIANEALPTNLWHARKFLVRMKEQLWRSSVTCLLRDNGWRDGVSSDVPGRIWPAMFTWLQLCWHRCVAVHQPLSAIGTNISKRCQRQVFKRAVVEQRKSQRHRKGNHCGEQSQCSVPACRRTCISSQVAELLHQLLGGVGNTTTYRLSHKIVRNIANYSQLQRVFHSCRPFLFHSYVFSSQWIMCVGLCICDSQVDAVIV